ncbi:MAG: hypothetical protein HY804_12445 [Nitrospinae bacterium]|nr:hypothetical protein [Nitrospinota bacterium]
MNHPKQKRGPQNLENELNKQIGFLTSSSNAFDNGNYDEAVRLAVTLRVLLYDTPKSKSLLGQLGRKNILLLDTAHPYSDKNLLPTFGLTYMRAGNSGAQFHPLLDESPQVRWIDFNTWWKAIVISGRDKRCLSRGRSFS